MAVRGYLWTHYVPAWERNVIYFTPEGFTESWWLGTMEGILGAFWRANFPKIFKELEEKGRVYVLLELKEEV